MTSELPPAQESKRILAGVLALERQPEGMVLTADS